MLRNKIRTGLATGIAIVLLGMGPGTVATAQTSELVVIGNDRGGSIGDRAFIVDRLRAYNARVEIRGNICYSACTMYLGAGNVCVNPETTFGFHGPSDDGNAMSEPRFDRWSEVMGRYYNAPLRQWFMQDARYENSDIIRLTGTQLISIGYAEC